MSEVLIYVAPDFRQAPIDEVLMNSSLNGSIEKLQTAVTDLQTQITAMQASITDLQTRVTALEQGE